MLNQETFEQKSKNIFGSVIPYKNSEKKLKPRSHLKKILFPVYSSALVPLEMR